MAKWFAVVAIALATSACASTAPHQDDPLEGPNRAIYRFQTGVVDEVLDPVADGYRAVVPEPGRQGVRNVLENLARPKSFVNHLLQADPVAALTTTAAFAVDTVVGVGGIWRPSEVWNVVDEDTGFADTLTSWGFGRGIYVVLPLLGAGGTRKLAGRIADGFASPGRYLLDGGARLALTGTGILDARERTLDRRRELEATEVDPYAATRERFLGEPTRRTSP